MMMNRWFLMIGVFGLLTIIVRTPLLAQLRAPLPGGQFRAEVPFIELNGKLMVEAEMNGRKGRFLIDTAAPCAITHSFAEKLGVTVVDSTPTRDSNGNTMQTKVVNLESLKLGDVTFNHLQAICLEKGNMIESFRIDGIIGYNLMRMGVVKFDSKNHLFLLSSSDHDEGIDPQYCIPMIKDAYLTRFPIALGKSTSDIVMFDSGASDFYTMAEKNYFRWRKNNKDIKTLARGKGILSVGAAGIERPSVKYRLKMPSFKVGKATFENVTSITTSAIDSRMGSGLLWYGEVIIDYPQNKFYFIPFEKDKKQDLYRKEWDVDIVVVDGYLTAGMIWDYTKSSLKGGERIIEIEGQKYDRVDLYQATMSGLVSMPDDHARISYMDPSTGDVKTTIIRKH